MNMDGTTTFSPTNEPKCNLWLKGLCHQSFTTWCSDCVVFKIPSLSTTPWKEGESK